MWDRKSHDPFERDLGPSDESLYRFLSLCVCLPWVPLYLSICILSWRYKTTFGQKQKSFDPDRNSQ